MEIRQPAAEWELTAAPAEIQASGAPWIGTEEVEACPVCGCAEFTEQAIGFDFELITCRNPWRFVRCASCAHIWLNPRPAISELPTIYPPTYYSYNYEEEINPIAVRGKHVLDSLKFSKILKTLARPPGRYLDVGCGTGRFLRLMNRRGVAPDSIFGIELEERAVAALVDAGYRAYCSRVEDCEEIPEGALELVTMFHVIEHVDDPATVVRRIASWLAPGGVLAVETPNFDSLDQRLFAGGYWGGYHTPRHWNLFLPATLERLLRDAGLEPIATSYQPGHGFWIYSVHNRLRYARRPRRTVARLFNPYKSSRIGGGEQRAHGGLTRGALSLPFLVSFTGFDKLRAGLGFRTSAMLALARKPA